MRSLRFAGSRTTARRKGHYRREERLVVNDGAAIILPADTVSRLTDDSADPGPAEKDPPGP